MSSETQINGVDVPITALTPLKERSTINVKKHKGFIRILSSIRTIGLIEPLSVYKEGDAYVILDGYLRYRACQELNIESVPCILCEKKEAYTFNRMVNRLSGYQEMRMLRKSLENLDERTIADVFGMQSIRHRLAPTLVEQLHPKVAEAFEADVLGRTAATEMACVKPERQFEMLKEMNRVNNFGTALLRALILKTAPELRNPKRNPKKPWSEDKARRKELVSRLEEAEKQHDFYTKLYRQYSSDLLKMTLYVRKLITTPELETYLKERHAATLRELSEIVLESTEAVAPA